MKRIIVALTLTAVLFSSYAWAADAQPATQPATKAVPTVTATGVVTPVVADAGVLTPDAGVADPAETTTQVEEGEIGIGKMALRYVVEALTAILLLLLSALVRVLSKKWGFEDQSTKLNDLLGKAVGYAEQKAIKGFKLDGTTTSGADKMKTAVDFAVKMAKEYKLPDRGQDWWEDKLESWMGVNGKSEVSG